MKTMTMNDQRGVATMMNRTAEAGKRWAKRTAAVAVMAGVLAIAGLSGTAEAAVARVGNWTQVTGAAGDVITVPNTAYTAGVGADRVLLAALTVEYTTTTVNLNSVSVSYGGRAMTPLANNLYSRQGGFAVWVGYLKEADIAAGSNNFVVSWSDNGTATGANLYAATYQGVDQAFPVQAYATNVRTTDGAITFGRRVDYVNGGNVFYVAGYAGTNTTTTQATGFTASYAPTAQNNHLVTIAQMTTAPTANGSHAETLSVNWANATNAYHGIVVASLNPAPTPTGGYVTIPSGQKVYGDPVKLAAAAAAADELDYNTDQASVTWRALTNKSDGFEAAALAAKWTRLQIGTGATVAPEIAQNSPFNRAVELYGEGTGIGNTTTDNFTYLYQSGITGDFTVDTLVNAVQSTATTVANARAGIMVRLGTATNSQHLFVGVTAGNSVVFVRRATTGGTATTTTVATQPAPRWVRLVRSGNNFSAYYSTDASTWTQAGTTQTVTMAGTVMAGLAVTSGAANIDCRSQFDNFLFMPGGTSGMTTAWSTTATSVDTNDGGALADWTDGTYAMALKSGNLYTVNLFDYSPCLDATPSTLSVSAGQTVKGNTVSLPALVTSSGNIAGFTYKINGATVLSPWNSFSLAPAGTSTTATLEVTGTDPDCGGRVLVASQTITIDNTCIDATPSTITIRTGQSAGGPAVDLTRLFTKTGNVGSFTYKINGVAVTSPWDSMAYGLGAPVMVTFEVHGTDPDCGGNALNAVNQIEIDNSCVRNPPSISFDDDEYHVGKGRAIPVKVTFRNEDTYGCGSSTFSLAVTGDSNLTDFNASYFNPVGSNSNITLAGREARTVELVVSAKATAVDWQVNNTQIEITSSYANHNLPAKTAGTAKTTVFLVSPITHNSVTTHSTKWGGKWGTSEAGAKYGNFDCMICHQKQGPNVKWLRGDVTLPEGTVWGVPGAVSRTVVFKDANAGSPDWGNDDPTGADLPPDSKVGPGRIGSNRICEVCHSSTLHHRYDTELDPDGAGPLTKQTDGYTHFNNRDCTDCHRHSGGFTADCTGCHGDPPLEDALGGPNGLANIPGTTGSTTPGTHYKHTVVLGFPCEYCHNGWRNEGEMPKAVGIKQQINHVFNVFFDLGMTDPERNAGHYTGQDGVNYTPYPPAIAAGIQAADGTILPGKGTMTCENIYCHGGAMGGTNPQWNGNVTCNACHGTTTANPPPGLSHQTHVSQLGLACVACHGASPAPGSNGHVNGRVKWDVAGLNPAYARNGVPAYSGAVSGLSNPDGSDMPPTDSYGSCTNISCHYGRPSPPWNNNGQPAGCTICHSNGVDNDGSVAHSAPTSGNHYDHLDPVPGSISEKMLNAFVSKCQSCHGPDANTGKHAGHSNGSVDFGGGMSYNSGTQTCASQCHDLQGVNTNGTADLCDDLPVAITWGSTNKLACQACHSAPYIGPTVVDPAGAGGGMAAAGYGSHLKVTKAQTFSAATNWTQQCRACHPYHADEGKTSYAEVPLPPDAWDNPGTVVTESDDMQTSLGLQYLVTGGVHLGGCQTTGTTEADICWNCHGVDTEINEWGYNADTNGANVPYTSIDPDITNPPGHTYWQGPSATRRESYNYGYLYTTNHSTGTYTAANATTKWVDASGAGYYRRDAYQHSTGTNPDYVLSQRIVSVHSGNFDDTKQVSSVATNIDASGNVERAGTYTNQETAANIRCTYCHDVHDLNKAVGDSTTGRPYLRGSWLGNPYGPDMPPITGYTYPVAGGVAQGGYAGGAGQRFADTAARVTHSGTTGAPRLWANPAIQNKGGYFIDQNTNWPTHTGNTAAGATLTVEETAGVCITCHGTDIDNMDFYPNATTSMWRTDQVNGHANSTLGGGGKTAANARNLFDGRRGGTFYMAAQFGIGVNQWDPRGINPPYETPMDNANNGLPSGPKNTGWYGGTVGGGANGNKDGDFTAWFNGNTVATTTAAIGSNAGSANRAHDFTCSKCHTPHASGLPALLITNCLDEQIATWSLAANPTGNGPVGPGGANTGLAWQAQNNCHRKESTTTGWHRLNVAQ